MRKNKARGPDCLPIEVAKAPGDEGAIWMTGVLDEAMGEGIPEEWRTSTITPIYKQKGDPLELQRYCTFEPHIEVVGERSRKQIEKNGEHQ